MAKVARYLNEAEELDDLAKLAACTTRTLMDNPNQDFLREMYTALDLNSHWKGQFFTPYHISHFMASAAIGKEDEVLRERGWIGIHDPACGAGSLLIAARNVCAEEGIGYFMARHNMRVFTPEQLYRNVWNDESDNQIGETVRSGIKALRKKLGSQGRNYIQNEWGIGYCFAGKWKNP